MLTHDNLVGYLKQSKQAARSEAALEAISLYPEWTAGINVEKLERYQFGGKLYLCLEDHITVIYPDESDKWQEVQPEEPNNSYGIDNSRYNQAIDDYTMELIESGVIA